MTGDFDQIRSQLLNGLQALSPEEVAEHRLDCVMIDECQDYSAAEIAAITRFGDQVYAAADNRQRIYQTKGGIEALRSRCSLTELKFHYRNGRKICQVADGIMSEVDSPEGMKATSQYKEAELPSRVNAQPSEPLPDQVERCIPEVLNQLRAYPQAMIGILCPRRPDVQEVFSLLLRSELGDDVQVQLHEAGYDALSPDRRVLVGTISGAKGLEFRALHLLGMDRLGTIPSPPKRVRLAYTAVTRAKTSLDIYRAGDLIGRLDNGLNALNQPDAPVELDDLFRS